MNTARVQAGSQYAALESAVNYTTDLTAQYEFDNTVNDVNFSKETAHLAKIKSHSRRQQLCLHKQTKDSKASPAD